MPQSPYPKPPLVVSSLVSLEWVECFAFASLGVCVERQRFPDGLCKEQQQKKSRNYKFRSVIVGRTYSPIFWWWSFFKLQSVFESLKCIARRQSRPISLSNLLTMEGFRHWSSRFLKKVVLVALKRDLWLSWRSISTTVPSQSIRQPLWRVTHLTKIWFHQVGEMSVTRTKFRQAVVFFFSKLVGGHLFF